MSAEPWAIPTEPQRRSGGCPPCANPPACWCDAAVEAANPLRPKERAEAGLPKPYRTIVVDPPWDYNELGDAPRGARAHYSCMGIEALKELSVRLWAYPDAHLYLWTTNAFIEEAHELARFWGFRKRQILTWVKTYIGMGYYFRNTTEHILFCTVGRLPPKRHDLPTHFIAKNPGRRHSAKPEAFYDMVESMSPGPYLDVFARRLRMGWDCWGNEVYNVPGLPAVGIAIEEPP